MLRLASDADFNGDVVRGLFRLQPDLDLVRVQDVGLRTADDPTILQWTAAQGRILLTHDRAPCRTSPGNACAQGKPCLVFLCCATSHLLTK